MVRNDGKLVLHSTDRSSSKDGSSECAGLCSTAHWPVDIDVSIAERASDPGQQLLSGEIHHPFEGRGFRYTLREQRTIPYDLRLPHGTGTLFTTNVRL
jgi:hypothetical protein